MTPESQPTQPKRAFDDLWDYNNAAETEKQFRAWLTEHDAAMESQVRQELMTQIARTQGLQREFEAAHATLDDVERALTDDMHIARVRYLLERGRTFNSSNHKEEARPLFIDAWELAREHRLDGYAVDAAHMMGIVEPPDAALPWNETALELAMSSPDPAARGWRGSLLNNIGWTYFAKEDFERALLLFDDALLVRREAGKPDEIRIARWCRAKTLRRLGRVEEALGVQFELEEETKDQANPDGYIPEEIAECLFALGRREEARPYFRRAHELLSADPWLVENEPDRIARLKSLANGTIGED